MSFWSSFVAGFVAIVAIIGIIIGLALLAAYYNVPRLDVGGFIAGTLWVAAIIITAMLVWIR